MNLVKRAIALWFGFLVLAFVNGAFREFILIKQLGIAKQLANQLSCLTGIGLWTVMLALLWKKLAIKNFKTAALVGLCWFAATMVFETFIIGRNLSWQQILHTYDVTQGEYWGLVLLWIGLMPMVFYFIRNHRRV
jgi:hypothetical protein